MKGPSLEGGEPTVEPEEQIQSIDQEETAVTFNHNNKPHEPEGDILDFEFPLVYRDIQKYLSSLFS
jgi:hypothetical protein